MAHGFSATRDDGLPAYAEAFRDAGFAVILFDYRHFGASTGEPRQLLDIGRQHDDYRAVVAWARRLDGIDPDRIVLWGSSFSGGHVLAVAAGDPRVAAVISQAPFTDAIPALMRVPLKNAVRLTAAGLWDQLLGWLRPSTSASTGRRGARHIGCNDGSRCQAWIRGHRPAEFIVAQRIRCPPDAAVPVLSAWPQDCTTHHATAGVRLRERHHTPPSSTIKAAKRAPRGELRRYPYGHFDIYTDPKVKADQIDFLRRVVAGVAA